MFCGLHQYNQSEFDSPIVDILLYPLRALANL